LRLPRFIRRRLIAAAIRAELQAHPRPPWAVRRLAMATVRTFTFTVGSGEVQFIPAAALDLDEGAAHELEPKAPAATQARQQSLPPGRQVLSLPRDGFFGRPWQPFPAHARSARWAELHRFAQGADRQRDPRATHIGEEPPLALVCPGCELEQAPITEGSRDCPYCGLHLRLHGPRIFWWRAAIDVPEWKP
jgi:hypothetical protein